MSGALAEAGVSTLFPGHYPAGLPGAALHSGQTLGSRNKLFYPVVRATVGYYCLRFTDSSLDYPDILLPPLYD